MFDLSGKVACVTGASSGLGQVMADALIANGARVVGVARRQDALEQWASAHDGHADFVAADLGNISGYQALADQVSEPFGAPDILINAAGINLRQHADDVTPDSWQQTLNLNLTVPFFLAQALVPPMKQKNWGRIINIASLQTWRAFANGIAYGASKAGVAQLTRAMAEAWSADGITANAIAPGFFKTELTGPVFADPELAAHHARQTCIGRNGEPQDIAGPVVFLSSDASRYVTGQVLSVDGGYTAK
jgi:NAD(P)-dependent dehydrogenase (short-subunit alcohol dehydrogenase family)